MNKGTGALVVALVVALIGAAGAIIAAQVGKTDNNINNPPTDQPAIYQQQPTVSPAPAAPTPVSSDWAVEVWKDGNPAPLGAAFFSDYNVALAWSTYSAYRRLEKW